MQALHSELGVGKVGVVNGLRALAIFAVIGLHLMGEIPDPSLYAVTIGPVHLFAGFFLTNGYQGVTLFFILSGFVLSLPYFDGRRTMKSPHDAWSFYLRRLRRLGPLYVLCVLISMIFVYPHRLLHGLVMMLSMAYTFSPEMFKPSYNVVLWSLPVEALFSVFLPLLIVAVRRYGMARVFAASVALSLAARCFTVFVLWTAPVVYGLPSQFDYFACGVLLAWLYAVRRGRPVFLSLFLGILLLFGGLQALDLWYVVRLHGIVASFGLKILFMLAPLLVNIGFFFIIDAILRGRHRLLTWMLETGWLQMIGIMSYSVYVWHFILITPLQATLDPVHLLRYFIMLLLLSAVTYRFVEFGNVTDIRKLLPSKRTVRFPLASWFRTGDTSDATPL